jgi:hypothetical protein
VEEHADSRLCLLISTGYALSLHSSYQDTGWGQHGSCIPSLRHLCPQGFRTFNLEEMEASIVHVVCTGDNFIHTSLLTSGFF